MTPDDALAFLDGTWEGVSRSGKNDPTVWRDTKLVFKCNRHKRNGTVTGEGVSFWREMRILFDITGTFDFRTKEITLQKRHKGAYTNVVEYKGVLVEDTHQIIAKYKQGDIRLQKKQPDDCLARWMTGGWSGLSVSKTQCVTKWTRTKLYFHQIGDKQEGRVTGRGTSLWRGLEIEYELEGEYREDDKRVTLRKRHKGQYQNVISYVGVYERRSDGMYAIHGFYDGGKFHLEQLQQVDTTDNEASNADCANHAESSSSIHADIDSRVDSDTAAAVSLTTAIATVTATEAEEKNPTTVSDASSSLSETKDSSVSSICTPASATATTTRCDETNKRGANVAVDEKSSDDLRSLDRPNDQLLESAKKKTRIYRDDAPVMSSEAPVTPIFSFSIPPQFRHATSTPMSVASQTSCGSAIPTPSREDSAPSHLLETVMTVATTMTSANPTDSTPLPAMSSKRDSAVTPTSQQQYRMHNSSPHVMCDGGAAYRTPTLTAMSAPKTTMSTSRRGPVVTPNFVPHNRSPILTPILKSSRKSTTPGSHDRNATFGAASAYSPAHSVGSQGSVSTYYSYSSWSTNSGRNDDCSSVPPMPTFNNNTSPISSTPSGLRGGGGGGASVDHQYGHAHHNPRTPTLTSIGTPTTPASSHNRAYMTPSSSGGYGNHNNGATMTTTPSSGRRRSVSFEDDEMMMARPLSSNEARRIERLLSGVWYGESVDRFNNATRWSDTAMCFRFEDGSLKGGGVISGEGISVWRDMHIDFDVVGSFDWHDFTVRLTKQHKGRFTNRIVYTGVIKIPDGESAMTALSSSALSTRGNRRRSNGCWSCCIEGTYPKGTITLFKRSEFEANVAGVVDNLGRVNAMRDGMDQAAPRLQTYMLFLSGVVVGGVIDSSAQEALFKFRTKHAVSDSEHEHALKSLGLTKAQFSMMMRGHLSSQFAGPASEDVCKICFTERINAVILPCGHFCCCNICGEKVKECPMCRVGISKIQPIFRS